MLSEIYAVIVCPSVHLCVCPVTLRYCIKTAKHRITQITPHDSPVTSFLTPKFTAKFEWDHPLWGRQIQVGWVKICHSTKKRAMTQKRYKTDAQFLLMLNRKSYVLYGYVSVALRHKSARWPAS